MQRRKFIHTIGLTALATGVAATKPAFGKERFRISIDTNPSHFRNKTVERFAAELTKRVDVFDITIYPSGQLFADRDIPKALRQGAVEMGVPGLWQLDGYAPEASLPSLPMFFGIPQEQIGPLIGGNVGKLISNELGKALQVHIPGQWLNLGSTSTFAVKPIKSFSDYKGLKIRYPGGTSSATVLRELGANPVLIPYPDLPIALSQNTVDAVLSSNVSIASAKLWDSGLKYAFLDNQFYAYYAPMINATFWNKQSAEIKKAITESWAIAVAEGQSIADESQRKAVEMMVKDHGLQVSSPTESELTQIRAKVILVQPDIVKKMKMNDALVQNVFSELKKMGIKY